MNREPSAAISDSSDTTGASGQAASLAWLDLRRRFLAAIHEQSHEETWRSVWRLLAEDELCRKELARAGRRVLLRAKRGVRDLDDLVQEALLVLARDLQRSPGLGFNPEGDAEKFTAWLRSVLKLACREALRRSIQKPVPQPPDRIEVDDVPCAKKAVELYDCLDLREALRHVSQRERLVLVLYSKGKSLSEISRLVRISSSHVHRVLRSGLRRLEVYLDR